MNTNKGGERAKNECCFLEPSGLAKASKTDGVAISPMVAAAAMIAAELSKIDPAIDDPFDDSKFQRCDQCGSYVHETTPRTMFGSVHPQIDEWVCDRCLGAAKPPERPKNGPVAYNLSFLP